MSAKEEKLRRLVMAVVIFICILGWSLTKFARIMGMNVLVAVGIIIAVLIISLILVAIILIKRRPRINFYKKIHSIYAKISLESLIKDYKEELEFVRRQFASDPSPTKNRVGEWMKRSKEFPDSLFDYDVINKGHICYGFLMDAPRNVFKKSSIKNTLFTGFVAFSLDPYFESNPTEYLTIFQEIAKNPKAGTTVFSRNKIHTIPEVFTKGRKAYITTIAFSPMQLPPGVRHDCFLLSPKHLCLFRRLLLLT